MISNIASNICQLSKNNYFCSPNFESIRLK
jgi:hypothetical protein